MSASHERVETLFNQALKFAPAERAAFLAGACGDDDQLRRQLEEMLRAEAEAAADRLEASQEDLTLRVEELCLEQERAGSQLGRYKLLERLGEGGFGEVWLAEQKEPVRRKVALKIIKLGMDTKQVIARFEAERQALAMMEHPSIAKVLDAGATAQGRPYFVMELVRGIPITTYCDENKMANRERLGLFISVCQAVQHAHQKGIIHRDIKPSNILVTLQDGAPVPKVIDFGIAKATRGELTDKTIHTHLQQFIGTPAYMSPEQAELSGLDIDTRSDIYSLGVLLYELLTGKTPFEGKELLKSGLDEMRRTLREKEPARPSAKLAALPGEERTTTAQRRSADPAKLLQQLQGDLDWIVMKCLEKDRSRRYETASGLAADLKRYLANEPVLARAPSAVYKFQKAVKRNKLAFGAAGAVALALIAGAAAFAWKAKVATANERKARASQAEATRQANLALDTIYSVVTTAEDKLGQRPDTAPLRKELLELSMKNLDQIARHAENSGLVDRTIGVTLQRLGVLCNMSGQTAKEVEAFQRSLAIFKRLMAQEPQEDWLPFDLAISYDHLGEVARETEPDPARAMDYYKQAQSIRKGLVDRVQTPTPGLFQRRHSLVVSSIKVAALALELGDPALARDSATGALKASELIGQDLQLPPPPGKLTQQQVAHLIGQATALIYLAQAEHCLDQAPLAREHAAKALEQLQRILSQDAHQAQALQDLGRDYEAIGEMEMESGNLTNSLNAFHKAQEVFEQLSSRDSGNLETKWYLSNTQYDLAALLQTMGTTGSEPLLTNCLATRRMLVKNDPGNIAREVELMQVLARTGDLQESERLADKVLAYAPRHPGKLFQTACAKAQSARRLSLADGSDRTVSERYGGQAVAILVRAIDSGWKDTHTLRLSPDLAPLRERDDFKALCKKMTLR
jgi:tetratricopeptide (TPR) repeat protein